MTLQKLMTSNASPSVLLVRLAEIRLNEGDIEQAEKAASAALKAAPNTKEPHAATRSTLERGAARPGHGADDRRRPMA